MRPNGCGVPVNAGQWVANAVSPDETIVDPAVYKINLAEIKPFEVEEEP